MAKIAARTGELDSIHYVQNKFSYLRDSLSLWSLTMIRRNLLNLLVLHNARVSLLIAAQLQASNGSITIPVPDFRHPNASMPGVGRCLKSNKLVRFSPELVTCFPSDSSFPLYHDGRNLYKDRPTASTLPATTTDPKVSSSPQPKSSQMKSLAKKSFGRCSGQRCCVESSRG
ncbi:hypothetical protein GEMRC1_007274 [Eukaryota sp. GEM-RC1]